MSSHDRIWVGALALIAVATPAVLLAAILLVGALIGAIFEGARHEAYWPLLTVWEPLAKSRAFMGEAVRLYILPGLVWGGLATATAQIFQARPGVIGGLLMGLLLAVPACVALGPVYLMSTRAAEPPLLLAFTLVIGGLGPAGAILAMLVERLECGRHTQRPEA